MPGYTAAVITISDKGSRGERVDTSGPSLVKIIEENGWDVVYTTIIPDDMEQIKYQLVKCSDEMKLDLVLTTGGTGFAERDITPEATKAVIEREVPGIPEAMRAESMRITPRGCLSRGAAGIRNHTLIVNLPGSEKASKENLEAVLPALDHGCLMLQTKGSANCAEAAAKEENAKTHECHHHHHHHEGDGHCPHANKKCMPSVDEWLREAKADPSAAQCGMFLTHNGVVRQTAKARVRAGEDAPDVSGLHFEFDAEKVDTAIENAKKMDGIYYIRVWLNEGDLEVGDDIMLVLVGGDIRPRVVDCLQALVGEIKNNCVVEQEKH